MTQGDIEINEEIETESMDSYVEVIQEPEESDDKEELEQERTKNTTLTKGLAAKIEIEKQLLEKMLILRTRTESLIKEKNRQQKHIIQSN